MTEQELAEIEAQLASVHGNKMAWPAATISRLIAEVRRLEARVISLEDAMQYDCER